MGGDVAGLRKQRDGSAPEQDPGSYAELAARVEELQQRVDDVVAQLDEARQHNLRLAEIVDVVQELLVPLAHRDEARLAEAIESFTRTV